MHEDSKTGTKIRKMNYSFGGGRWNLYIEIIFRDGILSSVVRGYPANIIINKS